tara:strand:- start:164 stop:448 length:285 start_codon:yes stop_codon:yes gene_type:complete
MKINLLFQRRDDTLEVSKSGDTLTFNGVTYDFSVVPEGALLPRDAVDCPWLASDVERIDGVLHLSLIVPHGPADLIVDPAPLINPADGPLEFPQ